MNFIIKYKLSSICVTLLAFLGFIGYEKSVKFTEDHAGIITIIIFLLLGVISVLAEILCNNNKECNIKNNLDTSVKVPKWEHSILIVDDKDSHIAPIMDCLKGYNFDIVTSRDITDYRFAENFEIIIGDIWGLGASGKNSISVLNQIKRKYPYKIVLAMSSAPATCKGLKVDGEIISKENKELYPQVILEKINYYIDKLDKYDEHWDSINTKLKEEQITANEIQRIKENYYSYIKKRNIAYEYSSNK